MYKKTRASGVVEAICRYKLYTHFYSVGIAYTHFLIPSDEYQSCVVEVYYLPITYYNREIIPTQSAAYTNAKHVKYIHMRAAHIASFQRNIIRRQQECAALGWFWHGAAHRRMTSLAGRVGKTFQLMISTSKC